MNSSVVQLNDPNFMGGWFAPFSNRQYCSWFFWIMVLAAVSLVLNVMSALVKIVSSGGKLYPLYNPLFWSIVIMNTMAYITNRLLYTMCLNSV